MENPSRPQMHSVVVEDFDDLSISNSTPAINERSEAHVQNKIGLWFEGLCLISWLTAIYFAFHSSTLIPNRADLLIAIGMILLSIVVAAIVGNFNKSLSSVRFAIGIALVLIGIVIAIFGGFIESPTGVVFLVGISIAITIAGWSAVRLSGESIFRAISLGLAFSLPCILLIDWGRETLASIVNPIFFFLTGVLADFRLLPFVQEDTSIEFATGILSSTKLDSNLFGVVVPLAIVASMSILRRASLIICSMSMFCAILWWCVFRSVWCIWMVEMEDTIGLASEYALSGLSFAIVVLFVLLTDLFLRNLFAPIPIDQLMMDQPMLAQIYNMVVSFPQSGPINPKVFEKSLIVKENLWVDPVVEANESMPEIDIADDAIEIEINAGQRRL